MEGNINTTKTEITDINKNLENFRRTVQDIKTSQKLLKQQYKEEFKELKKSVQNIKTRQDLLSRKYEAQKYKLQQLTKDHKKIVRRKCRLKKRNQKLERNVL